MTTTTGVRCRAALCCLVAALSMAAACSSSGTSTAAADDETTEVSWLASQSSDSGRIEFTEGEATKLVLNGIDLHTIMFSDRPERLTDVVDTAAITDQWDELFADSAPNAVPVEHRPDGDTDSLVVVLSSPVLDIAAHTLTYDIEVLADEDHPESVSGLAGDVHDEAPTDFRAASLFIDNMTSGDYIDQKAEEDADAMEEEAEATAEAVDDAADAVEDRADVESE